MSPPPDVLRGFDARLAGHLHVEEADVGPMRFETLDGLAPVARLRHDLELRPGAREQTHQRLPQQGFIVGDQSGCADAHAGTSPAGKLISAHTPRGCISERLSRASPPNARFNRSRSVARPVPSPRLASFIPTPVSVTRSTQRPSRSQMSTSM